MKLSSNMLNSAERILSGFNRATTMTLGDVTLLVKAGPVTQWVLFSVVEDMGPYKSDLVAFHEGCAFNVPPNDKLFDKRWAG